MELNALPDLCLIRIFSYLPVSEKVMTISLVCQRWAAMRPHVLSQMHSLTLLIGPEAANFQTESSFAIPRAHLLTKDDDDTLLYPLLPVDEFNSLSFSFLSLKTVFGLQDYVHHVTDLTIVLGNVNSCVLWPMATLLHHWSGQLEKLHMFNKFSDGDLLDQNITGDLFCIINSMSSLKSLSLDFKNAFAREESDDEELEDPREETNEIDLPIIRQLEEFNFFTGDSHKRGDVMWKSLRRYGQENPNLRVRFGNAIMGVDDDYADKLLTLDPQFCARWDAILTTDHSWPLGPESFILNVGTFFSNLTKVSIKVIDLCMYQISNYLSALPHLIYLRLNYENPVCMVESTSERINNEVEAMRHLARQLPSVLVFDLVLQIYSHHDLECLNLSWVFPSVQIMEMESINFTGFRCSDCRVHNDNDTRTPAQKARCRRILLKPCAALPALKKLTFFEEHFDGREDIDLTALKMD